MPTHSFWTDDPIFIILFEMKWADAPGLMPLGYENFTFVCLTTFELYSTSFALTFIQNWPKATKIESV